MRALLLALLLYPAAGFAAPDVALAIIQSQLQRRLVILHAARDGEGFAHRPIVLPGRDCPARHLNRSPGHRHRHR